MAPKKTGPKNVKKEKPEKPKDAKKIDQLTVNGKIYGDYDCMLNMTNIEESMNKFYAIRVIVSSDSKFYCRILSGRVGEKNEPQDKPQSDLESAVEMFKKNFKTKTKKEWKDRGNLQYHPGNYTLIELDGDEDAEVKTDIKKMPLGNLSKRQIYKGIAVLKENEEALKRAPSSLKDLSSEFYSIMGIDIKKIPLGNLGKTQINKGIAALEEIKAVLNETNLEELSSKFYSTIPHDSGSQVSPTIIDTTEILKEKEEDMRQMLADI